LRLSFGAQTKTILGGFSAFEAAPPVAIITSGSHAVEYCKADTTIWNQAMFALDGESRFLRVLSLGRLGLAKPLQDPPPYPAPGR
jgi:hypothetical protein